MGNVTYRATENMSKKFGHLVHLKNLHYFSEIYTKPLHVDKIVCRMKVKIEDLNLTIECHTCNCKFKKYASGIIIVNTSTTHHKVRVNKGFRIYILLFFRSQPGESCPQCQQKQTPSEEDQDF